MGLRKRSHLPKHTKQNIWQIFFMRQIFKNGNKLFPSLYAPPFNVTAETFIRRWKTIAFHPLNLGLAV